MLGLMDKIMYKGRKFIPDRSDLGRNYYYFKMAKDFSSLSEGLRLDSGITYCFNFHFDIGKANPNSIDIESTTQTFPMKVESFGKNSDLAEIKNIRIYRFTDKGSFGLFYNPQHFSSKEESLYDYVRDILNGGVIKTSLTHIFQCFRALLTERSVLNVG